MVDFLAMVDPKVFVYLPFMKLVWLVLLFHPYRVSLLRAIKVTAGAAMPFVNFRDEITMVSFL